MRDRLLFATRSAGQLARLTLVVLGLLAQVRAQAPQASPSATPRVPEWAQPGSATHTQVAPPVDFHRPSQNFDIPIGLFDGQSDVGSALVPGSASLAREHASEQP